MNECRLAIKAGYAYHEEIAHGHCNTEGCVADDIDGLVLGVQGVLPRATRVASVFDIHQLHGPSLGDGVYGLREQ